MPAVIVSPFIPRGTIDHTVYDHASAVATIERLFGLGSLTNRDRKATDLLHLLSLASPRADAPLTLPEPAISGFSCEDDPVYSAGGETGSGTPSDQPPGSGPDGHEGHGGGHQPPGHGPDPKPKKGKKKAAVEKPDEVSGVLWGFAHVALLKDLHGIPLDQRDARRQAVQRFLRIRTDDDCRRFIHDVRQRIRAAKPHGANRRSQRMVQRPPEREP